MNTRERLGFGALGVAAVTVGVAAVAALLTVFWQGYPVLSWEFLFLPPREGMTRGGIGPALVGTLGVTTLTALLAVPVGIGAALWLNQVASDGLALRLVRLSLRNLAGVPSIVYGLFGVALFVHGLGLGLSMLSSGLTLGLLTLPWTITASEEALKTVPRELRDGALALGATRWEAMRTVLLPTAAPGILTGVILGLARAAGETAPLLFTGVTFFTPVVPRSPLDQYMALPYHLYVLATQHHDLDTVRPLAYGTALVLLSWVGGLTVVAATLRARWRGPEAP